MSLFRVDFIKNIFLLKKLVYMAVCLMFFNASLSFATQNTDLTYVVLDKPKQVFQGFGASQPRDSVSRIEKKYSPSLVKDMSKQVYKELGMNWAKLWVVSSEDVGVELMKYRFYKNYINNGLYNTLKDNGVQKFLLGPARGEEAPRESMREYASKLAKFISDIYKERGIRIDVTGIANEPQKFQHQQISQIIKYLRQELDRLGMQHVGIIAPEWANSDRTAERVFTHLESVPEAWSALRGIATHSYNMAATDYIEDISIRTGKEFWQTETGGNIPKLEDENPGDIKAASASAATFLNDMNHSVTHWFWFIGFGNQDPHVNKDSNHVLVKPNAETKGIKHQSRYFYFKQLRNTFELGSIFYAVVPPTSLRSGWTYGQKPAITTSVARNPDGSWGVAVVNTTGINGDSLMKFYPKQSYTVAIKLPEVVKNKSFQLHRSEADGISKQSRLVVPKQGYISVMVRPYELITLRSL